MESTAYTRPPAVKYATEQEKEFLDGLGRWSLLIGKVPRIDLLKGYQHAIRSRNCWGAINRFEIERHVVMLIERQEILAGA